MEAVSRVLPAPPPDDGIAGRDHTPGAAMSDTSKKLVSAYAFHRKSMAGTNTMILTDFVENRQIRRTKKKLAKTNKK
jgi:hypothetical protein